MSYSVLMMPYSVGLGMTYHMGQTTAALLRRATPLGVRVYVACPAQEQVPGLWDLVRSCCPPERIFQLEPGKPDVAEVARRVLQTEERVVAHVHGMRQLLPLRAVRRESRGRLKTVFTVHSFRNATWRGVPYSLFVGHLLRKHVDYTHFLSPRSALEFVGSERVLRGGRGGIMLQGLDWPEQPEAPDASSLDPQMLAALDDPHSFRFLYLATVHAGKGHHWLIQALAPVLCRHPNARIIMPGRQDPRVVANLRKLIAERGVERQIVLPGLISRHHVPWLISRCNVGLVTSRSETFGYTILEPMAGGRPVIGTRRGVGEYLIMDYFTGIGFEYRDSAGLARAAEFMITHPAQAAQMGENAARLVRPLYTLDNAVTTYLRIYDSLWMDSATS